MFLIVLLLLSFTVAGSTTVLAAEKVQQTRAIAIVFDNSGSMYTSGNKSWCRATYAMEVFASMLNEGDILQIYPMWPITVDGKEYTMDAPFQVTDAAQASMIREIFTPKADGTPIETIDCAANGVQKLTADKKYVIVLTDGSSFYKNGVDLYGSTVKELDACFQQYAGEDMTVMYLGIGGNACMPNMTESDFFTKKKAADSADVLSTLTVMCNQVFGRDILPAKHISGKDIDFDISMKKMIVFVQGESVSNLRVTGDNGPVGTLQSTSTTKYSTTGAGNYKGGQLSQPDTSLQGMMVTYTDCPAGSYTIDYTGTATSVEVYYEPDADLDFIFTDVSGNDVEAQFLYEGEYKVSYGMKDAKTGQLIESDLLGNPHYEGNYAVNGVAEPIVHDGYRGETPVSLKKDDTFDAELTVTYLSGYTITKDSSDFGWPEGGIQVATRPAGDLVLEITGGAGTYFMQTLENGEPYIAKVFYQGTQLTGEELKATELKWDASTSNAEIIQDFADDHYDLYLCHKDQNAPENTVCGPCTVNIHAFYTAPGSEESEGVAAVAYNIEDDTSSLRMDLYAQQDYIVIGELEDSQPIAAKLTMNGLPLTEQEFAATELTVDCGGLEYKVTEDAQNTQYLIHLLPADSIEDGVYTIRANATYTDLIERENTAEGAAKVTLSSIPLLVKWVVGILGLAGLIAALVVLLHTKVLPSCVRPDTDGCSLSVGGRDVTDDANFYARLTGKQIVAYVEYNGDELGRVVANKLASGKESYLCKPSHKRSIMVRYPESLSVSGEMTGMDFAGVEYAVNGDGVVMPADEQQAAYTITNGSSLTMSGKTLVAGKTKNFNAEIPLNFKKR